MGQVQISDLLQNFDFSLERSLEEMFTTHFALSTLFKLRYPFARLFLCVPFINIIADGKSSCV